MSENELTLDILDIAIAKVKEYQDRTLQGIHINPDDWRKAKAALKNLCQLMKVDIKIPEDRMWGIKVVEVPELLEGTMLMVYDEDNLVKIENVAVR